MVVYTCGNCNKEFKQKGHYTRHTQNKTPCKKPIPILHEKKFTAVDLFSGAGGMTQGFVDAGVNVVFGVEFDKYAAMTYRANFSHPLYCEDIEKIDDVKLREQYGPVDIVFGGPSCQGFSMAGKRDIKDPRNSLFMSYLRFVKTFSPKYFVMENVPGILTMKTATGELVIDIIKAETQKLGYNLKWKKLIASDYGVPQIRKRIIFLGWKEGENEPNHPDPIPEKVVMSDILLPREEVDLKYYHSQKMIDGFNRRAIKNKAAGKGFGAQFISLEKPCYTISARYYKDGSDALVKYSETEIRKLTEKEAARVQSFPDSFIFPVPVVQIYKQIGNAVPCKLAYHFATSLLKAFKEI